MIGVFLLFEGGFALSEVLLLIGVVSSERGVRTLRIAPEDLYGGEEDDLGMPFPGNVLIIFFRLPHPGKSSEALWTLLLIIYVSPC